MALSMSRANHIVWDQTCASKTHLDSDWGCELGSIEDCFLDIWQATPFLRATRLNL